METINYSWKVVHADPILKAMTLTFSAPGLPDVDVGMPMPNVGDDLQTHIAKFAPLHYWRESQREVQMIEVGHGGFGIHTNQPTVAAPRTFSQPPGTTNIPGSFPTAYTG